MKTALLCGVSGQDGSYLAKLLLEKGYRVVGTSRDAQVASFGNSRRLGVKDDVECCSMVLTDFRSTLQTLARVKPQEVYNLAGQSSCRLVLRSTGRDHGKRQPLGTLNLLEAIRFMREPIRLEDASSTEAPRSRPRGRGRTNPRPFVQEVLTPWLRPQATGWWSTIESFTGFFRLKWRPLQSRVATSARALRDPQNCL